MTLFDAYDMPSWFSECHVLSAVATAEGLSSCSHPRATDAHKAARRYLRGNRGNSHGAKGYKDRGTLVLNRVLSCNDKILVDRLNTDSA